MLDEVFPEQRAYHTEVKKLCNADNKIECSPEKLAESTPVNECEKV